MTTLFLIWQSLSLVERVGVCTLQAGVATATYLVTVRLFG